MKKCQEIHRIKMAEINKGKKYLKSEETRNNVKKANSKISRGISLIQRNSKKRIK